MTVRSTALSPTHVRAPRTRERHSLRAASADLPRRLWLYLPFALLAAHFALAPDARLHDAWFIGEGGLPELGTLAALSIACALALGLVRRRRELPDPLLAPWIALLALGTLLWAGEEASWGQHWFHWRTPEFYAALNHKHETNLHNLSEVWLDYVPRIALLAAVLAGGILAPLAARIDPRRFGPGTRASWWLPTYVCAPAAALALACGELERVFDAAGFTTPALLRMPNGEIREYYLALFVLLYVASLRTRLAERSRTHVVRRSARLVARFSAAP